MKVACDNQPENANILFADHDNGSCLQIGYPKVLTFSLAVHFAVRMLRPCMCV